MSGEFILLFDSSSSSQGLPFVMNTSTLYPPNIHQLGDAMVGDVLQRVNSASCGYSGSSPLTASSDNHHEPPSSQFPRTIARSTKMPTDENRLSILHHSASEMRSKTASLHLSVEEQERAIHRNKRRIYQQRYRKKLIGRETAFEDEVAQLRAEVQRLQQRHRTALSGIPTLPTPWQVVAEYYSLFRNGLKPLMVALDVSSECIQKNSHVQKRFLEANMASNVATNSGFGVSTLLAEWEQLRVCYPDLKLQLVGMTYGDGDAVRARSERLITITEQTLRNAFPHLVSGEIWSPLAAKLLGQRLVVATSTRFEWDEVNGRINSVFSTTDIVTPLLKILGNLDDVARVMKKAHYH